MKAKILLLNRYRYAGEVLKQDDTTITIHDDKTQRTFTFNRAAIHTIEWGEEK